MRNAEQLMRARERCERSKRLSAASAGLEFKTTNLVKCTFWVAKIEEAAGLGRTHRSAPACVGAYEGGFNAKAAECTGEMI